MTMTKAQEMTLRTIETRGGTMNGYAGQKGFRTLSLTPLVRLGYLKSCGVCLICRDTDDLCETAQKLNQRCYCRVEITPAGRQALAK